MRALASFALREIGDPRAAEAMTAALDDPAWQVRSTAVAYLGELGDVSALKHVRPLLADPHIVLRSAAAEAIAILLPLDRE
jgi:HEAT repeat protein